MSLKTNLKKIFKIITIKKMLTIIMFLKIFFIISFRFIITLKTKKTMSYILLR